MSRPPKVLGYRGSVLLVWGVIWFLIGVGKFASPPTGADLILLTGHIPPPVRAGMWCATGLTAMVCAFRTRASGDAAGWIALYIMPALLAAAYSISFLDSLDGSGGLILGWLGAAVYVALAAIVAICAGWPEPADGGAA
jgi:hypothetical protein